MQSTFSCTSGALITYACNDGFTSAKTCACKLPNEMDEEECLSLSYNWSATYGACRNEPINPGCETSQMGYWVDSNACQYYWNGCDCLTETPIVVDVNGNGFALTDHDSGVRFDLDSDGTKEQRAWLNVNSDDAFLVLDRNGNGVVDNGTELFGNRSPQPAPPTGQQANGFRALAVLDGNGDGKVDNNDSAFGDLRLWRDANHDGVSQAEELATLPALGVSAVETHYKEAKKDDQFGNHFAFRAKVFGGSAGRWAWDVYLR